MIYKHWYEKILNIHSSMKKSKVYAIIWMVASPQNASAEILTPNGSLLVGRAFGRYLGSWGWSPLKRLQRDPLPFSPYKDTVRRYQQHPRKKDLTRRNTTQLVVFHYSNPNRLSSPNGTSQYFSIISTGLEKKDIYKGKIFLENSFYFICFNTKIVSLLHL